MKYADDLAEGDGWVFDPMTVCHWEVDIPYPKNGKYCYGCVENGEEYEFPAGELKACGSGFCRGHFCGVCRGTHFVSMADDWRFFVVENAVGLVGLAPQKVAEGSEEYNYEYVREALEEAVNEEDDKRLRSWCVTCFLSSHKCDDEECDVRALVNGNCMGGVHENGMQNRLTRKRKLAVEDDGEGAGKTIDVKSCTVSQGANKKVRITIDLTVE